MKSSSILLRLVLRWLFSVLLLIVVIIPLKGQVSQQIAPPNVTANLYLDSNELYIRTNVDFYLDQSRFYFDIALDSTFTNILPGWNNREISRINNPFIGNASSFSLFNSVPGTTYYIRGKVVLNMPSSTIEISPYSKTTSATIPIRFPAPILLPIKALDSTSAIVDWIPYKNFSFYRLNVTSLPASFETACDEQKIKDTTLVPSAYRNIGKLLTAAVDSRQGNLLSVSSDTVRGLSPGILYRFQLLLDTTQQSVVGFDRVYLVSEMVGNTGFTAEERNYLNRRRKFLPFGTYRSLPMPQSISYYEAPLANDSTRYFTISDSNNTKSTSRNIIDFSTPRIPFERILSRLDSMKKIGIPIDTAYIALDGMLGYRYGPEPFPSPDPSCYFARVTCVFTLRHPDARVKQFARPGNGWRYCLWDTDYRRFIFPTATSVRDENTTFASDTPTLQSNPNPFTDETTITFTLPSEASTKVEVFSTLGLRMAVFPMERHVAGTYTIPLQATQWASGTYLVRLTMFDAIGSIRTITHKISLLH